MLVENNFYPVFRLSVNIANLNSETQVFFPYHINLSINTNMSHNNVNGNEFILDKKCYLSNIFVNIFIKKKIEGIFFQITINQKTIFNFFLERTIP